MADVDVAVRIGRAVMADPDLPIIPDLAEPIIETRRFPPLQDRRLEYGKIRLHRKGGAGQIERVFIVHSNQPSAISFQLLSEGCSGFADCQCHAMRLLPYMQLSGVSQPMLLRSVWADG